MQKEQEMRQLELERIKEEQLKLNQQKAMQVKQRQQIVTHSTIKQNQRHKFTRKMFSMNCHQISDSDISSGRRSERMLVKPTESEIKEILRLQQLQSQLMKNVYGTIQHPAKTHTKFTRQKSPITDSDGYDSYKKDQISKVTEQEESESECGYQESTLMELSAEQARHLEHKAMFEKKVRELELTRRTNGWDQNTPPRIPIKSHKLDEKKQDQVILRLADAQKIENPTKSIVISPQKNNFADKVQQLLKKSNPPKTKKSSNKKDKPQDDE